MHEIALRNKQTENRSIGLVEAFMKHCAVTVEKIAVSAEIKDWNCQRRLIEARHASVLADHEARAALATAAARAEEAEAESRFLGRVRSLEQGDAQRIVGADAETQRLLLERDRLRRERVALQAPQTVNPAWPVIEPEVTEREIETIGLRAVRRAAELEPSAVEDFWRHWREQAQRRLPAYAANEVIRRAGELWEQSR